ncbi:ABC1 kinase family protein [Cognatilysobacter tabacisoli]|uniref:ABC1 kinase family protein n=1 Tax=Cognatilysobacter tabacisoli TaxID=2315424 RepID=UPI000E6B4693|nr:AarF/UbiB family protein [Lysobacter tabacisoli]
MDTAPTGLARTAQILGFLLRYRDAGIFTGLDLSAVDAANAAEVQGAAPVTPDGRPDVFVDELEALGPTFIKIGQALSTRPDMVPPPYLAALERMQDDCEPVAFDVIRDSIEAQLGVRLNKVFDTFDETPLAAASLAQVHRATLRDGRAVAVKVQRPGVTEVVTADLDALDSLAAKADRFTDLGRRLHFVDWVQELRKTLMDELDYRGEAENLERFARHFAEYPEIVVPQPVWDYVRPQLLVMELVAGTKATDISGLRRTEQSLSHLATAVMRAYLDQVFVHGEIHADPHPGNLLVTDDGRIALLDLGMVAHVPPRLRGRLLKLLFAAVDGRGEEVAQECMAIGTRLEDFDEERFVREVGQRVARYAAHGGGGGTTSPGEGRLVLDLTRLGTACGLRTPPELSLLGKTLLNLEAVSHALDPDLDVKDVVEDHLESVMRARLKKSFSAANLASEAMEVQSLLREAPGRVSSILALLSENRLQVRLTGLEESRLLENLQKIANRISAGVITAALILASAMLMRVEAGPRVFGYPALAFGLLVVAVMLGLAIVVSALRRDRTAQPVETHGPR